MSSHTGHEFQFHKGTIKTNQIGEMYADKLKFQFHKGTIKTQDKSSAC